MLVYLVLLASIHPPLLLPNFSKSSPYFWVGTLVFEPLNLWTNSLWVVKLLKCFNVHLWFHTGRTLDPARSMLILTQAKHNKRLVWSIYSYHRVSCHYSPPTPTCEPLLGTTKNRRTHQLHLWVFTLWGRTTVPWSRHQCPHKRLPSSLLRKGMVVSAPVKTTAMSMNTQSEMHIPFHSSLISLINFKEPKFSPNLTSAGGITMFVSKTDTNGKPLSSPIKDFSNQL